jgi:hypothetical protein
MEAGLENTLPKVWGLEGPLKKKVDRARKHTTYDVRARKPTQKWRQGYKTHYLRCEGLTARSKRGDGETLICQGW